METTDVAIVGAGPYGLALAARLRAIGVERVVFGSPFAAWRNHMPAGMILKSEPVCSDISAPNDGYSLRTFCASEGIPYADIGHPVSLATFLRYADWWLQLVPDIRRTFVAEVIRTDYGFKLTTDEGAELSARRVVVGTGLLPFAYVPHVLQVLPDENVSHSSVHTDLAVFNGKRVAVVGGGQSALETAALLHESEVDVELVTRRDELNFIEPNPDVTSFGSRLVHPVTKLGVGWHSWAYYHLSDAFRALPAEYRAKKAYTSFGPSGAWWLRPRIEGRVPVRKATTIVAARTAGNSVHIEFGGENSDSATYDHVIAATGYSFDVERLKYISPDIRRDIAVRDGVPTLSRSFESSVPNLFFLGAITSPSLGPNMRFLSGTHFTARRLARRLRPATPSHEATKASELAST